MDAFDLIYYDSVNHKNITILKITNKITKIDGGNDLDLFDIGTDFGEDLLKSNITLSKRENTKTPTTKTDNIKKYNRK